MFKKGVRDSSQRDKICRGATPNPNPVKRRGPSIGDLSADEAIEDIEGIAEGETADGGRSHNAGRGIYRRQLEKFAKLDSTKKHDILKETWKEVAMGAALRAKAFVATCAPKDFGRLYQMIMAGAVSIDKAFPPKQEALNAPSFVFNMFGSLGQRAAAIAMPSVPIQITNTEVSWTPSVSTPMATLQETPLEPSTSMMPSASSPSDLSAR
jgi:hypothetical protein